MTTSSSMADAIESETHSRLEEDLIIHQAISILEQRMYLRGPRLQCPHEVRQFLRIKLSGESLEVFAVLFLDNHHRVLAFEPMFYGSINGVGVSPRRILQRALEHNSAAIIVAHNHPSGISVPSNADKAMTLELKQLLPKVDVDFLDHFIIGEGEPYSFAEAGLI